MTPNPESHPTTSATPKVRQHNASRRHRERGEPRNDGWVKIYRCLVDHPRFPDGDWLKVWLFLLCKATHADYRVIFAGQDTVLSPGQLITSRPSIVNFCDVERSKVERILKTLETEQQIEQRTSSTCRLITIVNWDKYQRGEQPNEPRVSNDQATGEQRVSTHKNRKNDKNGEERQTLSADAEGIYDLYPRKVGRPAALKAIQRALARTQISVDELKSKTEGYAKACVGANFNFVPHPATWYNQDRFNDAPEEWRRLSQTNCNGAHVGAGFQSPLGNRRGDNRRPPKGIPDYENAD